MTNCFDALLRIRWGQPSDVQFFQSDAVEWLDNNQRRFSCLFLRSTSALVPFIFVFHKDYTVKQIVIHIEDPELWGDKV